MLVIFAILRTDDCVTGISFQEVFIAKLMWQGSHSSWKIIEFFQALSVGTLCGEFQQYLSFWVYNVGKCMDSVSFYCFQLQLNGMQTFHYGIVQNRTHVVRWLYSAGPYIIHSTTIRDHFVYAPSQWEATLQCNVIPHWLGACTKWSLCCSNWGRTSCYIRLWTHKTPHSSPSQASYGVSIVKIWGENCLCYNGTTLCRYAQDTSILLDISFAWQLFDLAYHKISNIRCSISENLSDCCRILQLPVANPLKPGVKLRMEM